MESNSPTDLKQLSLKDKGHSFMLMEGEISNSVVWQVEDASSKKGAKVCVLTNQRLLILNGSCEVINSISTWRYVDVFVSSLEGEGCASVSE